MTILQNPAFREKVRILLLTVCLLGLQFSWSVELGCGTQYLKKLGLSSAVTALVWLAGPLSGLIMQPLVGAYSDVCTSRFGRRRPFMVAGALASVFSCFMIGWAEEISKLCTKDEGTVDILKKFFAVFGFYLLDFAINAVQAACRALIIDAAGKESQEVANAWAGRMIGLGGLAGFFFGTLPLEKTFGGYLGNTQMQVICVLGSVFLCFFIGVTCLTNSEVPLERAEAIATEKKNPFHALIALKDSWKHLPREAQQLCNVQFFAWIGWMPFYFYTSQWVTESYRREFPDRMEAEINREDEMDGPHGRAGSLAMTLFSVVCLFSSFVMPLMIAPRGRMESHTGNRPWWKRIRDVITLPRMYTASHLLFASCLLLTPLALKNVTIAIALPAIAGLSYAVTAYVPFVILTECVDRNKEIRQSMEHKNDEKEIDLHAMPEKTVMTDEKPSLVRSSSQLTLCLTEVKPTKMVDEMDEKSESTSVVIGMSETNMPKAIEGGAILGIHNCYIVLPQFLTSLLAFIIFQCLDNKDQVLDADKKLIQPKDDDAIGWVLRVGGVSLLVAAFLSLRIK